MTQDNLIARLRLYARHGVMDVTWMEYKDACSEAADLIEHLSPPLDGEGVIQAATFLCERLREHENCDEAGREFHGHVVPALARMESALSLQDKT